MMFQLERSRIIFKNLAPEKIVLPGLLSIEFAINDLNDWEILT